jgi:hypothetical protein
VHRKLLGDIAPIANDLSTFTFGFAEAIFIKYFGDLTAALVAEIKDAPNIEDLRLPWFVETTCFCRLIRLLNVRFSISMAFRSASGRCPCRRAGRMSFCCTAEAFLTAIAVAQQQKARSFELRAALSLAKLYQSTGRVAEAHAVLAPALQTFSPTPEFLEIEEAQTLLVARFN